MGNTNDNTVARGIKVGDRLRNMDGRQGVAISLERLKSHGRIRNFIKVRSDGGDTFYILYGNHRKLS